MSALTKLVGMDVVVLNHHVRIIGRLEIAKDCYGSSFFQVAFVGQPNETVCARFDELNVEQVDGNTIFLK